MNHWIIGVTELLPAAAAFRFDKKMQRLFTEHPAIALLLELAVFCLGFAGITDLCVAAAAL